MAWATPNGARAVGYLVTAANWNELALNEQYLKGQAGTVTIEDDVYISNATDPTLRLTEAGSATSYAELVDASAGQFFVRKVSLTGQPIIEVEPNPTDGSSAATVRVFRLTNTSGRPSLDVTLGTNSATVNCSLAGTGNSYLNANNGDVGIGTTSIDSKLHVATASDACAITIENEDGADAGDVSIVFKYGGTSMFSLGWDNSGTSFSISEGGTLGTNSRLTITDSDVVTLAGGTTSFVRCSNNGDAELQGDQNCLFGCDSDNDETGAYFAWYHNASTELMRFTDAGLITLMDTANANMTIGLTINQGTNDNQILAFKSSDVGTGLTTITAPDVETDDFCTFQKFAAATGGLLMMAMGENAAVTTNLRFDSYGGQASATHSTAGRALIEFYASQHNGSNALSDVTADGNVFGIRCRKGTADVTIILFDEDGDAHNDGADWAAFDAHDDVALLDAINTTLLHRDPDPVRAEFAAWVRENRSTLEALPGKPIITFNEDGHHFVNQTKLQQLLVGAVRQLGRKNADLESRIARMEAA